MASLRWPGLPTRAHLPTSHHISSYLLISPHVSPRWQVYLLECLQKTAPPVIIFCESKQDVDDVHEYLLLKGVGAVAIHGGKDQEERE